jgi:hypothetical protein
MRRGLFFAMAALALLALDFTLFPDLIEDRIVLEAVPANNLVSGDLMTMGKYRLHTLRTSSGRIADVNYVRKLGPRVNGLAITAFAVGADRVGIGGLADSVRAILPASDAENLVSLIRNNPTLAPGKVQSLRLQKPAGPGPLAGIDVILILRAKQGGDRESKEALRGGLVEILQQAGRHSISGLLLPALTVTPDEKNSPTFDDFYRFLFEALRVSKSPRLVDISFFGGWSTSSLESATAALNAHWGAQIQDRGSFLAALHRFETRLLLIGLAICFVASSRYMVLGLRSACILGTAYTLSLLGSFKTIETLTAGFDNAKNVALIGIMFVLAIGFPSIVSWSVKDLFSKGDKDVRN